MLHKNHRYLIQSGNNKGAYERQGRAEIEKCNLAFFLGGGGVFPCPREQEATKATAT